MRLSIRKANGRTYYYVLDAHREGKKIITTVAENIGEHSALLKAGHADPLAYARERLDALNRDRAENRLAVNETYDFTETLDGSFASSESTAKNIGWLYIHRIYRELGPGEFLSSIGGRAKYDMDRIVEYLAAARFLRPGSKRDAFLNRKRYFAGPDYGLHDSYRLLGPLSANSDELQKKLFEGTKKLVDIDDSVLYYDCTNFYFECESQDENLYDEDGDIIQWGLRRYGASKEHRPNPIVQMGLFTDRNGIPISYCVHHGSNNEQNTVIPLESRMVRDYRQSKFIYCSDGGLGSFDNRFYNSFCGRDYVVTQSLKKTPAKELELIFKDMNWEYAEPLYDGDGKEIRPSLRKIKKILDRKFAGKELTSEEQTLISRDMIYKAFPMKRKVPAKFAENSRLKGSFTMDETLYVTFSAKYYLYQKTIFERQLETAKEWIGSRDPEKVMKGPNDVRRFIRVQAATEDGVAADTKKMFLDDERVKEEKRFHGFYAVATSLEGKTIGEIMDINASRWKIEQSFRILKSDFDARPMFVSKEEQIRGHIAICYIALLIYRIMESKLQKVSDTAFSSGQIINTIRNMNVIEISDGSIFQAAYTGSKVLNALESLFGLGLDKKYYYRRKLEKKFE